MHSKYIAETGGQHGMTMHGEQHATQCSVADQLTRKVKTLNAACCTDAYSVNCRMWGSQFSGGVLLYMILETNAGSKLRP